MHRYWKVSLFTAAALFVGACGLYVWPTPYHPIEILLPAGTRVFAAREQRFSHQVQVLTMGGWRDVPSPLAPDSLRGNNADTAKDPVAAYLAKYPKR